MAQILEARDKLSHDLQYRTKLQGSYGDTIHVPFSNEDGVLGSPVGVLGVLKGQDDSAMLTSFSNIHYGKPQPINQDILSNDTISETRAVPSDNISSSVPVQLLPILKDTTVVTLSRMEESTHNLSTEDAAKEEQSAQMYEIPLTDNSAPKDDEQKQPLADISEQSRVDIQKTDNVEDGDIEDDDGDEWLEEETGDPGDTKIPIAHDEDVSFSDLEEDDDAA